MDFGGFYETVNKCWDEAIYYQDPARTICAKLKSVRYGLKMEQEHFHPKHYYIQLPIYYGTIGRY
jgi:hypothetical protein